MKRIEPREIPGPTEIRVRWRAESRDAMVVRTSGSLDSMTAGDFAERLTAILRPAPRHLLFDLGEVDYLSSMGLSVILKTAIRLKDGGSTCRIYDPRPSVRRVLEIARWDMAILDPAAAGAGSPFFGYLCEEEPLRQSKRLRAPSPAPPRLFQN